MDRVALVALIATLSSACITVEASPSPEPSEPAASAGTPSASTTTHDDEIAPQPTATPPANTDSADTRPEGTPTAPEAPAPGTGPNTTAPEAPQDAPAGPPASVDGDGVCANDEDHVVAPHDCTPPDVTFSGGSLDALKRRSRNLHFRALTITGTLELPKTLLDADVQLVVDDLRITSTGRVGVHHGACDFGDSPSLTIAATGDVTIEGEVTLTGRPGHDALVDSTCVATSGAAGGDLTIVARNISIKAALTTSGGQGAMLVVPNPYGSSLRIPGDGGNGGAVVLEADERVVVEARIDTDGGASLTGSNASTGEDGADGALIWRGRDVAVREMESNGTLGMAQRLALEAHSLAGTISVDDDGEFAGSGDVLRSTFPDRPSDRLEDVYEIANPSEQPRALRVVLSCSAARTDLDLYVYNPATGGFDAQSIGPTSDESVKLNVMPHTRLYIGVSAVARGPAVAYELRLE